MDRRNFLRGLTGLMLTVMVSRLNAHEKNARGPIIVEAGRRVDAPDATVARFPPQNVPVVRKRSRQVLKSLRPIATVSSAACGADLLLLDVAGEMHVPRYVLLPSEPEVFRVSSVTDRPGNWGELYSKVLRTSKVEVLKLPEGQEGYLETNLKLLDLRAMGTSNPKSRTWPSATTPGRGTERHGSPVPTEILSGANAFEICDIHEDEMEVC